jgi:hypothetical protein
MVEKFTENCMVNQLTFRPANISDAHQFADIMNSQYIRKKKPEYFYWQFICSYEPSVLMCAFEGSLMAGMFGLKVRKLSNGVVAGQAIDMLIAPKWRGKNLFCKLAEHAVQHFDKKFDILCVFANVAGSHAVQRSLGWQLVGTIRMFCLKGDASISSCQSSDMPLQTETDRVYFEKNNDYRQWRFDKNPEYSYYTVRIDKTAGAWVKVFVDTLTGRKFGDIVDMQTNGISRIGLHNILTAACKYLQSQNVEFITTWAMPETVLRSVAEPLGFKETNQERFFCIKILNPDCGYLNDFSAWHLVQADAEIF